MKSKIVSCINILRRGVHSFLNEMITVLNSSIFERNESTEDIGQTLHKGVVWISNGLAKGPFTNTYWGVWCKWKIANIFGPPFWTKKLVRAPPPFFAMKIMGQPHKLNFHRKICDFFSRSPLTRFKNFKGLFFASGPPSVCEWSLTE